jgi:hypothetical protein
MAYDTLQSFFGRVGLAGGFEGVGYQTDATVALSRIVRQYVDLSTQAESLRQQLLAKVKVPCEIWFAYAAARQDYLTKSQAVFDQLGRMGISVEQVVYSSGKPKPDPSDPSKTLTLRVMAPLRPPAFTGLDCPGLPLMQGAIGGGWQPVPIEGPQIFALGSVANNLVDAASKAALVLLASGVPLGVAGYYGAKTYKQVLVMLDAWDTNPNRILAAYTSCVESGVKSGLAPFDAANRCGAAQKAAQEYGSTKETLRKDAAEAAAKGLGFWGWLGVVVGVAVVGYVAFGAIRRSVGVARAVAPLPIAGFGYPYPAPYLVAMPPRPRRYRRRRHGR